MRMRQREAAIMRAYAGGQQCLMQLLTTALDDPDAGPCGRCSVCTHTLPAPGPAPGLQTVGKVYESLRRRPIRIAPRTLWPSGSGRKGKIAGIAVGRAAVSLDGGVTADLLDEIQGPDAVPSALLAEAVVAVVTRWRREDMPLVQEVVPIPSAAHPQRVRGIAAVAAAELGVGVREVFELPTEEVETAEGPARLRQVSERLRVVPGVSVSRTVLLVDDTAVSKWTLTQASVLLQEAGCEEVVPLVGAARA